MTCSFYCTVNLLFKEHPFLFCSNNSLPGHKIKDGRTENVQDLKAVALANINVRDY